jgi:hypothetical protein
MRFARDPFIRLRLLAAAPNPQSSVRIAVEEDFQACGITLVSSRTWQ